MIELEYLLDRENQKRQRKDKKVAEAWGHACNVKGNIIKLIDYYQPTLGTFVDCYTRNKVNPTWTKNTKKVFAACQATKNRFSKP